jgi:hypothetical protein
MAAKQPERDAEYIKSNTFEYMQVSHRVMENTIYIHNLSMIQTMDLRRVKNALARSSWLS